MVNSAIMHGTFSNDQLNSIVAAIKYRRSQLAKTIKGQLSVGAMVKFHSTKHNASIIGQVSKVAIKYVTVDTARGRWKVPASMLETL